MAPTWVLHPMAYEEEKELVRFILNCSRMGYGKTRGKLPRIVGETMKKKGRLLVGSLSPPVPVDQSTLTLSKSVSSSLHESPPLQSSSSVLATSPISKFLVYPTPVKKTKVSPTANKCARTLTSTESLQLLEEKEKKKKEETKEKARRKQEREEKNESQGRRKENKGRGKKA